MLHRTHSLVQRLTAVALLSSSPFRQPFGVGRVLCLSTSSSSSSSMDVNETIQSFLSGIDDVSHPHLTIHHLEHPVRSTQDEARRLLRESQDKDLGLDRFLAVIADEQTNGRGTQGRSWEAGSRKGNLFLTICVTTDAIPVKLTLLPLQVAVLVADRTSRFLRACRGETHAPGLKPSRTTVKWPNDVLINDQKLAGTLIESETVRGTTWFLIGIGINVVVAPGLEATPGKHVRGATCLQNHCIQPGGDFALPDSAAYALGVDLTRGLVDWVLDNDKDATVDVATPRQVKEANVIREWKSFAEFGKTYELRGEVSDEQDGQYQGEKVITVDIQDDGQLLVRGENGRERLLVAEYMF